VPGLVKAKCQDLTPFLGGDAIKQYPGLANIPPICWQSAIYDGGVYAVPIHRFALRFVPLVRDDLIKGMGLDPNFTSGDEFTKLCKAVTDVKKSEWAYPEPWALFNFVNEMVGTPNQWAVADGKFTRDYETEQMRQALGIVAQMWKDGVINPDGFASIDGNTKIAWLVSGKTKMYVASASWQNIGAAVKADDPNKSLVPVTTPKWEGGGTAKSYLGSGIFSVSALKKASTDRITEVLRVMDWLAAPWGTQEQILRTQGIKGWDYNIEDGAYVQTDNGKAEVAVPTLYISACPIVHYSANQDITKLEYESEKEGMSNGESLPTLGLYSDTALTKGVTLDTTMQAVQGDVIQGRKSLSDWDNAVKSWKSGGGDTIRSEYEKAWSEANK
jgi:putative aldouronate transport system substrate-binding protein